MKSFIVILAMTLGLLNGANVGANQFIYRDFFENGYANWSWANSVNCDSTSNTYEGPKACRIHYAGAWEGFFAGHYQTTNTTGYDVVTLAITAEGAPVNAGNIILKFKDQNQNDIGNGISLYSYVPYNQSQGGPYINPGEWRVVSVPLLWLSAMNRQIGGLMIMSSVGNTTIHVDKIKLSHSGLVQGTFYSDGPGINIMNESWTGGNDAYWAAPPFSSTPFIHQGDQVFRAQYVSQYEGVKLRSISGVTSDDKDFLTFWINSPASANLNFIDVQLKGLANTHLGSVPLSSYLVNPQNATWIPIKIHLNAFFGTGPRSVVESVVFLSTISGVGTVYFDDISLAKKVFRMPLPAGKSWQLTMSPGDRIQECTYSSLAEPSHQGINHHSIDINDVSAIGFQEFDVPVFAAGGGTVTFAGLGTTNGNYVVINHEDGYESRYLHFKHLPMVATNDPVVAGQQIGIVGETGTGTGTHLHLGFRYNGSGAESVSQLDLIRLEGLPIKSYTTECSPGTQGSGNASKYYPSSPYWQ